MNFTPTELFILRRLIKEFATAEEAKKIETEQLDPTADQIVIDPKDLRPALPEMVEVASAMKAIEIAVAHGRSYDEIAQMLLDHPRWHKPDSLKGQTLKQMMNSKAKGYVWNTKKNGWLPFFKPYKCYLIVQILKAKFPEIPSVDFVS